MLSCSAHLWPAAQAPSGAGGCPWASGGWGFTAGMHCVRGLSQASPSNVKAIKATSSVRSGRASGSRAAATTHLTSPPTASSLPLCGCAPGWTFFYSGGQDMYLWQEPVLGIFGSQRPTPLETPFLCPTHLAPTTLASTTPTAEQLKRKARTLSGKDGGLATPCSSTLVSLSKHLPFPFHLDPSIQGRGSKGASRGELNT